MAPTGPDRCPACGGVFAARVPYPARPAERARFSLNGIAICGSCGLGMAVPKPEQSVLDCYYATGAYRREIQVAFEQAHERSQSRLRVQQVRAFLDSKTTLAIAEVGAGYGGIPRALSALGMKVSRYAFVEPDETAAAATLAMPVPFPRVRVTTPRHLQAGSNNVLFVNHVLEHVNDPVAFLEGVLRCVSPDGIAYVETPHSDYRYKDDVFPHLYFFTRASMLRLAERMGVVTLACDAFGLWPATRWTPIGFAQRIAARVFRASVRGGWDSGQRACDRFLWRYAARPDGIWLRWIFRVPRGYGLAQRGPGDEGTLERG